MPQGDNIRGNRLEMWLHLTGGAELVGTASIGLPALTGLTPVTQTATGSTPVRMIVERHGADLSVEVNEITPQALEAVQGVSEGQLPAIGAAAPAFRVSLHDPQEQDHARDICIHAGVFVVSSTVNGQGARVHSVTLTPTVSDDGRVIEIGDPATVFAGAQQ